MDQYVIQGGVALHGEVDISGAKNAALAILAAAIMTDETVRIENLPDVHDVIVMNAAMEDIGVKINHIDQHTVEITADQVNRLTVDYEYIKKIRASYYLLGSLLGRFKEAEVALPGGCDIGSRPIDLHIKGFRAMGADCEVSYGLMGARADRLVGAHIFMMYS